MFIIANPGIIGTLIGVFFVFFWLPKMVICGYIEMYKENKAKKLKEEEDRQKKKLEDEKKRLEDEIWKHKMKAIEEREYDKLPYFRELSLRNHIAKNIYEIEATRAQLLAWFFSEGFQQIKDEVKAESGLRDAEFKANYSHKYADEVLERYFLRFGVCH